MESGTDEARFDKSRLGGTEGQGVSPDKQSLRDNESGQPFAKSAPLNVQIPSGEAEAQTERGVSFDGYSEVQTGFEKTARSNGHVKIEPADEKPKTSSTFPERMATGNGQSVRIAPVDSQTASPSNDRLKSEGDFLEHPSGEDETKESGRAESDVTGVVEGESGVNDSEDAGAGNLSEGLQRLAETATKEEKRGGRPDVLHCRGVEKWEALLANIASGDIALNPETGSFEHKQAQQEANGRASEGSEPERRQKLERGGHKGKKRKIEQLGVEAEAVEQSANINSRKLARIVNDFVVKLERLLEQDLITEMQRRASRCTPSTLGAKVSRLAGHANAGRGPASGYMDESAKNSAALREAAEPIIKALLFRGHYGTTTLATAMAGPLFSPANAAGPELLSSLRDACEVGTSEAGRAGPMRRLILELQEGIREAVTAGTDQSEEQATVQAWGSAVRECVSAQVDMLEAVDFFKLCCAEAAVAAQEESAGVMLTAKRSKRAILSSRQAAGSKSKWEHLEDSVAPLAQIVAQKYVSAAMHGGEGFSGLHARLQVLSGELLHASTKLHEQASSQDEQRRREQASGDPARLLHAIAAVHAAAGLLPSWCVSEADLPDVVKEYVWADPPKWGQLWQQSGVACNGPQVPEPICLPAGGGAPQEVSRKRRRGGGDEEEEDEYVGRWGRRVWRMKGAKKEWFNGQVIKGPRSKDEVKPADKCYVMRYKPQDDPQGRSTLEKLTEAQVMKAIENYERAVAERECVREESESEDDEGARPPRAARARALSALSDEAATSDERSKRKKGPSIAPAHARALLRHLQAFFGGSPVAFALALALYCGAERLFPRWERGVDGEGRHVYQWVVGRKMWLCYTRMQVRETQEEEASEPVPPRIQLVATPRPPPPVGPPKPPPPPALKPPPPLLRQPSRTVSPPTRSPSPPPLPPAPKQPSQPPPTVGAPVLFSFEGPPPGCRLTPSQEIEVMEVVRQQGWEIRQEVRKHGISAGQVDKYYMPPNGDKRLTSLRKVWEYLHHGKGQSSQPATASVSNQAEFDRARGGVAALLAAQAEAGGDPKVSPQDHEWVDLGVAEGFGMAAAERVKRRRRKAGQASSYGSPPTTPTGDEE